MYRGTEIICTIGARGGSKGVKNKNIRLLQGIPLIGHTIRQAQQCGVFDHIVVTTDSPEIQEAALELGAEAWFSRPAELATDTAAKIPAIQHAVRETEKRYGREVPVIVDLDATSPLRLAEDIVGALDLLLDGGFDSVITAMPSRRSPYFNLVERGEGGRVELSKKHDRPVVRRQDAPQCFDMNASIYVWKRAALMERGVLFQNTGLFVMPEERSIDIDSELDWDFVEFLMARRAASLGAS